MKDVSNGGERMPVIELQQGDIVETEAMFLFWHGWPSQWHPAHFEVDGQAYNCCEQYMMAGKARLFGDAETLEAILASTSPRQQKKLGRSVKNFVESTWQDQCREIVFRGNLARFSQDDRLKALLLNTGRRTIAEASPFDRIWGIGLAPDDPKALDQRNWRGRNWLGYALMRVRDELR
jgi:ribA/ribD-fused uncharacterized protein